MITNLSAQVTYGLEKTKSDTAVLWQSLSELSNANPTKIDAELTKIQQTLLSNLQPLTSFTGLEDGINNDFTKAKDLTAKWLTAVQPLQKYKLTGKGLVSSNSLDEVFTDDLAKFITLLENELITETNDLMNDFQHYFRLGSLLGDSRVKNLENLVESTLHLGEQLVKYQEPILEILGHKQSQRIVIFNQNTGEARPTGGFPGSYISIDLEKGRLNINESNSIYHPDQGIKEKLYMHTATAYYGWMNDVRHVSDHGIRSANFLPCFPETASIYHQGFLASEHGYNIDLVISITPQILLDFLGPDFSFTITDLGTFNSQNIMEQIEYITAVDVEDKSNPKKQLKDILEALIRETPTIFKQRTFVDWLYLILRAIQSRDVQLWSSKPKLQEFFEQTGLSNLAMCNRSIIPEIGFLLGNISSDKRNSVSQNHFSIYTENTTTGARVNLKYKQILPENPNLLRGYAPNRSFTFVGIQLPANTTGLEVSSPQAIHTPFHRPYYQEKINEVKESELTILPDIENILSSGKDLYDSKGNPPGFVYEHLNGSKVLGIYIHDSDQLSEVNFSFVVPPGTNLIKFNGQPGLRQPSLGLGQGISFYNYPQTIRSLEDYYEINSGVYLEF